METITRCACGCGAEVLTSLPPISDLAHLRLFCSLSVDARRDGKRLLRDAAPLHGHHGSVRAIAPVADDGRAVMSASWDGTLRLWDTREGSWLRNGDAAAVLQVGPEDGWVETVTVVRRLAFPLSPSTRPRCRRRSLTPSALSCNTPAAACPAGPGCGAERVQASAVAVVSEGCPRLRGRMRPSSSAPKRRVVGKHNCVRQAAAH